MISGFGKIEKMIIYPYTDAAYKDKSLYGPFTTLINPETYTYKYKTEYCETQGAGTTGVAMKFSKMQPQEFNFDFLFDGTGVVRDASLLNITVPNPLDESQNIASQINNFKLRVFDYHGDMHRPNYLMMVWGTLKFKGVLVSMDIEYKLFNHDGTPLRAIAKCAFKGSIDNEFRVAVERPESPDITHQRIFGKGDKLPLIAEKIYADPGYYIDVAKSNNMDSFRNIKPGKPIYFLPLE